MSQFASPKYALCQFPYASVLQNTSIGKIYQFQWSEPHAEIKILSHCYKYPRSHLTYRILEERPLSLFGFEIFLTLFCKLRIANWKFHSDAIDIACVCCIPIVSTREKI